MGLQTSTPGVTNDLTASTNIESNWSTLDVHDHSSGKGAQVPSAGININANLSFAGFKPYNLLATQFSSQSSSLSSASNKPCVYVLNGELRYIDNSGNDVQLTNAGSVNSATGSISGLSAPVAAGFASNTFSWQANSGTSLYAKMANSDISLYEFSAGVSNAVTLKSPTSLAASYSVLFPTAVPASTSYLTMSNTGQLATASADSIGQAMTTTGSQAIFNVRSQSSGIVSAKGSFAKSASTSGNLSAYTSTSYVNAYGTSSSFLPAAVNTGTSQITISSHGLVTGQMVNFRNSGGGLPSGISTSTDYWVIVVDSNTIKIATTYDNALASTAVTISTQGTGTHSLDRAMAFSLTTSGRTVLIELDDDGQGAGAGANISFGVQTGTLSQVGGYVSIVRIASSSTSGTTISETLPFVTFPSATALNAFGITPNSVSKKDPVPAAGIYTYKIQVKALANGNVNVTNCVATGREV